MATGTIESGGREVKTPVRSMYQRAKDDGRPPLLMSPEPGNARPSSLTSLRRPPATLG